MKRIEAEEFLRLGNSIPVIDVRSPQEFISGHIPGAVNIPLFDNEERAVVGTKYKKEGRSEAILEGLKLIGPGMHNKLAQAIKNSKDGRLLVHCWRGGMRSESMAWLFSLGDIETFVLEGGYKSYRNHILQKLSEKREMIVLGGMTGSSKTHILNWIGRNGHQFIDLEKLASHKGSAFGSLGQPAQPSTEQFANDLFREWQLLDPVKPVWLEDESRNIGTVFLPEVFYNNMQEVKTIVLMMDIKTRLPRLMEEYSGYPPEILRASVMKISKRLGGDNTHDAIRAIDEGDIAKAIEISLKYYDKAYQYSIKRKPSGEIIYVETDTDDIEINAGKVLSAALRK
ncbi:MAG: tRNA 2-selenouridine(34) synthase MnmH [Methanosarcina sp.]